MDSPFFPDGCFDVDLGADRFWRELYEDILRTAREPSLYGGQEEDGQHYRFFCSEGFAGVVRVQRIGPRRELIAKRLDLEASGSCEAAIWRVTEYRRQLDSQEWQDLQALADAADLWKMPPRQGPEGLDGFHCVVESRKAGRYRAVDRWCPEFDAFGRLCRRFVSLYDSLVEPERRRRSFLGRRLSRRFLS